MPPAAEVMEEESSTPVYDLPIPPLQSDLEEIRKRLEVLEKASAEKPESKSTESKWNDKQAADDQTTA